MKETTQTCITNGFVGIIMDVYMGEGERKRAEKEREENMWSHVTSINLFVR